MVIIDSGIVFLFLFVCLFFVVVFFLLSHVL